MALTIDRNIFARISKWQTHAISLLLHIILLILVGGTVLFQVAKENTEFEAAGGFVQPGEKDGAPPGPSAPSSEPVQIPDMTTFVPTTPSALSAITSVNPQAVSFQMPSVDPTAVSDMAKQFAATAAAAAQQAGRTMAASGLGRAGGGGSAGWGKSSGRGTWGQGLGQKEKDDLMLAGVLVDLKQDANRNPLDPPHYYEVLGRYIQSGFKPEVIAPYFQSKEIYTSHVYIPEVGAELGPKAVGLEKEVQPQRWFIHYRGGFSPPKSGRYRFWATADDTLIVLVNGAVMIDVSLDEQNPSKWVKKPTGRLEGPIPGEWMELSDRETYRLDLIVGENPGGVFRAFLMIEDGSQSAPTGAARPSLRLFSTLPVKMPEKVEGPAVEAKAMVMTPKRDVLGGR